MQVKQFQQDLTNQSNHLFFIDLFKAISIVAVVSFHGIFLPAQSYDASIPILETLFSPLRFCVPLFFTISFFLYELSELKNMSNSLREFIAKRLSRLIYPVGIWFGIAIMLNLIKGNSLTEIIAAILKGEIFTGSYYLLALIQLLPIFFYLRKLTTASNLILSFIFHTGISIIVYLSLNKLISFQLITWLQTISRPLFIYWLSYAALGIYLARNLAKVRIISRQIVLPVKICLLLLLGGLFIRDYQLLSWLTNNAIAPFDYLTLSSLLSVPIIFYCFSHLEEHHLPLWLVTVIKTLSKYSLGIFCLNGTIRLVFLSLGSSIFGEQYFSLAQILMIKLVGWLLLLLISLGLSILFARIGLKKAVC